MNKRHGEGFAIYADGSSYKGCFKNEVQDGQGIYRWVQGHEYRGMFRDGMMEGRGEFVHSSGRVQKGTFRRDHLMVGECFINPLEDAQT